MDNEVEKYLLGRMSILCGDRIANGIRFDATSTADALDFLEIATPFARVLSVLGSGIIASALVTEDAPKSLKRSIEHRYHLSLWPAFDFVIFESPDGVAWGQRFVRRTNVSPTAIATIGDLGKWSHTDSEIHDVFGEPTSRDGWPPWETLSYRFEGINFNLCFVFGLLQSVTPLEMSD